MRTKKKAPFTYLQLENRALLSADGVIVADFRDDFSNSDSQWSFGFNTSETLGEDLRIGALDGQGTLRPVNPTLDTGSLAFNSTGGHPGQASNRFAIATWTAPESGVYSITDSFIEVPSFDFDGSDGVEVRVFINGEDPLQQSIAAVDERGFFDLTIGYLNAGDSVRFAFGPNGNHAFDRFETDFSIRVHDGLLQSVANFRSSVDSNQDADFRDRVSHSQWDSFWNAPLGWQPSGFSGNATTGSIDNVDSYQPLFRADDALLTSTGFEDVTTSPSHHLRFDGSGGHTGIGFIEASRFLDRYAISAYTIDRSGRYALTDTFAEIDDASKDGVEVRVFVNGTENELFREVFEAGSREKFEVDFGRLNQGDTVYVAFGANDNHVGDNFETDFSLVRELPRVEPLREIVTEQVLYARDFGAIPNDRINDANGIELAIREARRTDVPTKIVLEEGIYNIQPTSLTNGNPRYFFTLIGESNLEIDGQGATLVVEQFNRGLFRVIESENVIIRDLTIDYAELYRDQPNPADDIYRVNTFSQGTIVSTHAASRSFVLQIDSDVSVEPDQTFVFGQEPGVQAWGYVLEGDSGSRLKYDTFWHYNTLGVQPIGGGQYRITVNNFHNIESGDRYVLQRRTNVGAIGVFAEAENVSVIDVTIHASPSAFVTAKESAAVNVIRSSAEVSGGRWRSINADAIHGQSLRTGFWVEDSNFDAVGDDVMNFYTVPSVIVGRPTLNQLTLASVNIDVLRGIGDQLWSVGDIATFVDPVEGRTLIEARVTAIESVDFGHPQFGVLATQTLTFDQPIEGVRFATAGTVGDAEGFRNDTAIYNSSTSKGFLVQGTTLSNARRYGQFLMADDVQLVDNTYLGLTDSAIAGHNESNWPIGLYSSNVLVQNNRFLRNGFSAQYFGNDYLAGVVAFNMDRLGHQFVERAEYGISRIEIVDNVFRGWGKTAIAARNVSGLTIENNQIYSPLGNPSGIANEWIAIDTQFNRDVKLLDNNLFANVEMLRELSNE